MNDGTAVLLAADRPKAKDRGGNSVDDIAVTGCARMVVWWSVEAVELQAMQYGLIVHY